MKVRSPPPYKYRSCKNTFNPTTSPLKSFKNGVARHPGIQHHPYWAHTDSATVGSGVEVIPHVAGDRGQQEVSTTTILRAIEGEHEGRGGDTVWLCSQAWLAENDHPSRFQWA